MAVPQILIIFASINYHSLTIDMKTIGCLQFSDDGKTLVKCTAKNVTSVVIPDGVTVIEWDAFSYCTSLTSVEIPSSVTKFDAAAFSGCTSLTSMEIPNSVTVIEWGAFEHCTSLTSVEIPNSVAEIGEMVFCDCTNLTSMVIPESVTKIGNFAFEGCWSLTELHCRHKKPLNALSECFGDVDLSKITLYVPIDSGYDYRHHPFFSKFARVVTEK